MKHPPLPLSQSREFERCCNRLGIPVQRHDWTGGTCLLQTRAFPMIGPVHLISRGPVSTEPEHHAEHITDILSTLKGPLLLNLEKGTRPARALRVLEGARLAVLDLHPQDRMRANLSQKWRNQLNKAERENLTILDQPLNATQHSWFLDAEAAQQRQRKYRSHPSAFLLAFAEANKGQARLLTAISDAGTAAAILIFRHGRMATYQAGVTTDIGRSVNAHNILLWQAMCDLQERGYQQLDLGRADLTQGLTHFKLGTGARTISLSGSFVLHRWVSPKKPRSDAGAPRSLQDVPKGVQL